MIDKLIKSALLFTAGAAVGAAGAMWLMSDSGKEMRGQLRDLASQAKDKMHECCDKVRQEMEAAIQEAEEQPAPEA
ncbi:MAG: YtxH domain-containing protein [Paludibacteraceae bacterium]|nr:YtxH domain-containing protein [Paludibacteraceae bacterium]